MFNISSLKPREKFLLLIMMSLIAFILIFFTANNAFSRLASSQDKLTSIQSDYEHVLKRYQQIERSINTEISQDKTKLLEALKTYIATTNVNLNTRGGTALVGLAESGNFNAFTRGWFD